MTTRKAISIINGILSSIPDVDTVDPGGGITFAVGASPVITQADKTTSSSTGADFIIRAQNATGASSNGGSIQIKSGTGTVEAGSITMSLGNTQVFEATDGTITLSPGGAETIVMASSFVDVGSYINTTSVTLFCNESLYFNINGDSIFTMHTSDGYYNLTYGENSSLVEINQSQRSGTGANAGATMLIRAQQGQNQTVAAANNNGGDIIISGGLPGTGGNGEFGTPSAGSIIFYSGEDLIGTFTTEYFTTAGTYNILSGGGLGLEAGFGNLAIISNQSVALFVGATLRLQANTTGLGFFGTSPVARPTGVAVTAAGIHAALVSLGLITA